MTTSGRASPKRCSMPGNSASAPPPTAISRGVVIVATMSASLRLSRAFLAESASTPPGSSLDSNSWQPVVWQKCSKSLTAPGSVASTSRTAPGGSGFNARRAFNTGSGHNSPVASRVVAVSAIASVMAQTISVSYGETNFSGSTEPPATRPVPSVSARVKLPQRNAEQLVEHVEPPAPAGDLGWHRAGRIAARDRNLGHPVVQLWRADGQVKQ